MAPNVARWHIRFWVPLAPRRCKPKSMRAKRSSKELYSYTAQGQQDEATFRQGRGLKGTPPVGTPVRLTGYFLKCTGQMTGEEGRKVWRIAQCDPSCPLCSEPGALAVAVDEPKDWSGCDVPEAIKLARPWRHIAKRNLEDTTKRQKPQDYP